MFKMKAAIIVDSTAGLTEETASLPNVFQLYLSTIFKDGTVYVDSPDESLTHEFYKRMDTEDELPKTSQPEPQQVYNLFDQIIQEGYDTVYAILTSEKISGTFQTVHAVSDEYRKRLHIHLIDSHLTSFVLEAMTLNLAELIQRQFPPKIIIRRINQLIDQSAFYFTPATLDNLVKGGRVSALSGFLGNALNIKPLITMGRDTNGEVRVPEKIRTMKKAHKRLYDIAVDHIAQYPEHAYVVVGHTGVVQEAQVLCEQIQIAYPELPIRVGFITPVLGTHGGSGAVSINVAPLLNPSFLNF